MGACGISICPDSSRRKRDLACQVWEVVFSNQEMSPKWDSFCAGIELYLGLILYGTRLGIVNYTNSDIINKKSGGGFLIYIKYLKLLLKKIIGKTAFLFSFPWRLLVRIVGFVGWIVLLLLSIFPRLWRLFSGTFRSTRGRGRWTLAGGIVFAFLSPPTFHSFFFY